MGETVGLAKTAGWRMATWLGDLLGKFRFFFSSDFARFWNDFWGFQVLRRDLKVFLCFCDVFVFGSSFLLYCQRLMRWDSLLLLGP